MNVTEMSENSAQAQIIDAMGKPCPMPLLMLKRALKADQGKIFLLKSSDPHSQTDVRRYCQLHDLSCQTTQISATEFHYLIEF
jgi:tRNA 2-thiouridine synthesizing protein A